LRRLVNDGLWQSFGKQSQEHSAHENEGCQYHPTEPPTHMGETNTKHQEGSRLLAKYARSQSSTYHRRTILGQGVVVDVANPQRVVGQSSHSQGQLKDEEHRKGEAAALGLGQCEPLELCQGCGAHIGIQQSILCLVAIGTAREL